MMEYGQKNLGKHTYTNLIYIFDWLDLRFALIASLIFTKNLNFTRVTKKLQGFIHKYFSDIESKRTLVKMLIIQTKSYSKEGSNEYDTEWWHTYLQCFFYQMNCLIDGLVLILGRSKSIVTSTSWLHRNPWRFCSSRG